VKVAVVIPVFNERESLPLVVAEIPRDVVGEIVVVDNGSTDDTRLVASGLPVRLVREERRGYGSACLAGISALEASPPEILVFLDGDYSAAGADLAIGSRMLGRREPGALLPQARFGNALACFLIRAISGHRYTDLGPFRAIRWEALRSLGMQDRDFGWTVEMQMKALKKGLRVVEVPVSYRRRVGVSKITGTLTGTLAAGRKILWTIARYGFGRS
jgi:glycosyltransferase involved in cell wall biosynthesis